MLLHGDEMGRTQQGNNNVYCQDNPLAWVDWEDMREDWALFDFTEKVATLRAAHPVFKRRRFFQGRPLRGSGGLADIVWFTPAGDEMSDEDWEAGFARSVMVFLNGQGIPSPDARGDRIQDDSFLLLLNAHNEDLTFTLPDTEFGESWEIVVDTASPLAPDYLHAKASAEVQVESRSMLVFRRVL
jgi:glycogen operon protein